MTPSPGGGVVFAPGAVFLAAGFFGFVPTRTMRASDLYDVVQVSVRRSFPFSP